MKDCKRVKDPIYGYIKIPVTYMTNIVDTSVFQRLRRVIQTSYSPLYSSAVHNRFVHSMGVFYLGELTVNQLIKEVQKKIGTPIDLQRIGELFKLACLPWDEVMKKVFPLSLKGNHWHGIGYVMILDPEIGIV